MKLQYIALTVSTLAFTAAVQAKGNSWEPGFSGDISVVTAYTSTNSQFDKDNSVTHDLSGSGSHQNHVFIAPLGTVSYTFSQADKQIFFGTSRSDVALGRFHIEAGYKQRFADRTQLTLSYIPGILEQDTWSDPFVTGQDRNETNTNVKAFRIQLDNIMGSSFSIQTAYGKYSVDNEQSGWSQIQLTPSQRAALRRDSDLLYIEGAYTKPLTQNTVLRTAINYRDIDADGKAMSNNSYGVTSTLIQRLDRSSYALTLSYKYTDFDAANPIFAKTQENNEFGAFLAYEYAQPFDWKDWGFVSLLGYQNDNSNINFYDQDNILLSVGMNYQF
ncbi:DUF2860 domain-containing protein [Photobacterium damselae]|uniref:DUF2860 domain-containing protein n=1 Tax=Photobacterium damselae TaxID=38293 RepID=UPI001EDF7067|nr:DUF2860 domain-containing protein [Photobacterium damselae]MCG3844939.1 DUF2860 domain-containing protein [Photobacterium damselae]